MKFTHVIYEKCDACIFVLENKAGIYCSSDLMVIHGGTNIYRLNMHSVTDRQL